MEQAQTGGLAVEKGEQRLELPLGSEAIAALIFFGGNDGIGRPFVAASSRIRCSNRRVSSAVASRILISLTACPLHSQTIQVSVYPPACARACPREGGGRPLAEREARRSAPVASNPRWRPNRESRRPNRTRPRTCLSSGDLRLHAARGCLHAAARLLPPRMMG